LASSFLKEWQNEILLKLEWFKIVCLRITISKKGNKLNTPTANGCHSLIGMSVDIGTLIVKFLNQ